jgi:hypothetical protein
MTITIPHRCSGPPDSGNGGYVCGLVGVALGGTAEVTLKSPPPLERPLELAVDAEGVARLSDGDRLIAEGRRATLALDVPAPPSWEEAEAAATRYPWRTGHPFPTCLTCGPDNAEGLFIFPAPVEGRTIVAAPYTPRRADGDARGELHGEFLWAALDCPTYHGYRAQVGHDVVSLLGRMACEIVAPVKTGERCVVIGWGAGQEGRKLYGASALFVDGELRARARATWIKLK